MSTFRESTSDVCFWCNQKQCCDQWVTTHREGSSIISCFSCAKTVAISMIGQLWDLQNIREVGCNCGGDL